MASETQPENDSTATHIMMRQQANYSPLILLLLLLELLLLPLVTASVPILPSVPPLNPSDLLLPDPPEDTQQHTVYFPSSFSAYYNHRDDPNCHYTPSNKQFSEEEVMSCIGRARLEYRDALPRISTEEDYNQAREGGFNLSVSRFTPNPHCAPSRRIYDTIVFNDELPLLLIRLAELSHIVDYFVIIESSISFSGMRKNLTFFENRHLFLPYLDRIIHVICDLTSLTGINESDDGRGWPREEASRDCTSFAFSSFASSDDLILQCDTDELPKPEVVHSLRQCSKELSYAFPAYNNWEAIGMCGIRFLASFRWRDLAFTNWCGCRIGTVGQTRYSSLLQTGISVNHLRRKMGHKLWLQDSEWHCSSCFFGDVEMMKSKFKSWSEISVSKKFLDDPQYFVEMQENCPKARYDGQRCKYYDGYAELPMYIQLNVDKFEKYMPDAPWMKGKGQYYR